jgi:hypothetical protein
MCWELILRGLAFCRTDWAVDARTRRGKRDTEIIGAGRARRYRERRLGKEAILFEMQMVRYAYSGFRRHRKAKPPSSPLNAGRVGRPGGGLANAN